MYYRKRLKKYTINEREREREREEVGQTRVLERGIHCRRGLRLSLTPLTWSVSCRRIYDFCWREF